jgi:hypothetical protein
MIPCGYCKFWRVLAETKAEGEWDEGFCRRRAPSPVNANTCENLQASWPLTVRCDGCGEAEPEDD